MSRHRFRSQAALQRSGGGRSGWIVALGLLFLGGFGVGIVGERSLRPTPVDEGVYPGSPTEVAAALAAAPPPPERAQFAPAAPLPEPRAAVEAVAAKAEPPR